MQKLLTPILLLSLTGSLSVGQTLDELQQNADRRLDEGVARLAEIRENVRSEKLPLAAERQKLMAEVEQIRREANRVQRMRDNSQTDLNSLEENVEAREKEMDYLNSLGDEYIRSLEAQADPAELPALDPLFRQAYDANEDPSLTPTEVIKAKLTLVEEGLNRIDRLIGGTIIEGQAVTSSGNYEPGKFVLVGPVTYFASSTTDAAGLGQRQGVNASVAEMPEASAREGIAALAQTGQGVVPLDPTLTNALALAATEDTLLEHVGKGGFWIYPILGIAFVALITALFKSVELYSLPKTRPGFLSETIDLLSKGEKREALEKARSHPGPMGALLEAGVKNSHQDPEFLQEVLYEKIVETQPKVMRLLPIIAVTAAVSPLLGLLGTVTGIINTFKTIMVFGTGDAKQVSGGISEALITTEFGLFVAIPSLIAYALLSRKGKSYLAQMERMSLSFVNAVKTLQDDGGPTQQRAA